MPYKFAKAKTDRKIGYPRESRSFDDGQDNWVQKGKPSIKELRIKRANMVFLWEGRKKIPKR